MASSITPSHPVDTDKTAWSNAFSAIAAAAPGVGASLLPGVRDGEVWRFGTSPQGAAAIVVPSDAVERARSGDILKPAGLAAAAIVWAGAERRVLLIAPADGAVPGPAHDAVLNLCAALVRAGAESELDAAWRQTIGEDGLAIGDDLRVRLVPAGTRTLLGLDAEQPLVGRPVAEIVPDWHLLSLDPGENIRGFNDALGCEWTCGPVRAPDGRGTWFVVRFRRPDTFEPQRDQQVQFLQALRHDVRSPLTALRGLIAVVLEEPEMPASERVQLLELLRQEAERVVSFVEDYLVAMSLRASPRSPHRRSCDLMGVFAQQLAELRSHARTRDITVTSRLVESFVEADHGLATAFVRSLVGAFFRLADRGAEIDVELRADAIVVRGSGPGLFQQRLDRPFTTLARSTSAGKKTPGAALGLFLAKKIADAHAWGVRLDQTDGGLSVTVLLHPAAQ